MNFREGIRRAFAVFAWFLAIATLIGIVAATPQEPDGYAWEQKIKQATQAEFDPSAKFVIQWESSDYGTAFVKQSCLTSTLPSVISVCRGYSEAQEMMLWTQAKHIAIAVAAASAVLFCVLGFWRLLDWILAGFGQRLETPPR